MPKLIFFNRYHNGDVFSAKGFIMFLQMKLKGFEFACSNEGSFKLLGDCGMEFIPPQDIPEEFRHVKTGRQGDNLYINTWIHVYPECIPHHVANYPALYNMWKQVFATIEKEFGVTIEKDYPDAMPYPKSIYPFIPSTTWEDYDIVPAFDFLNAHENCVLMCNGFVRSGQTVIGNLQDIADQLSTTFPDHTFIYTEKFSLENFANPANIYFTDDINCGVENGDLNEIGYISTRCKLILGKNSGPFMFAHTRDNLMDREKTFISVTTNPQDTFIYESPGSFECKYYHYTGSQSLDLLKIISFAITNEDASHNGQFLLMQ